MRILKKMYESRTKIGLSKRPCSLEISFYLKITAPSNLMMSNARTNNFYKTPIDST